MMVREVRPLLLAADIERPVRTSFGTMARRYALLVEVLTDAGLRGLGEIWCNFPPWAPVDRIALLQAMGPTLVGADPTRPAAVWERLLRGNEVLGLQWGAPGPVRHVLSGIDTALWDIAAQAAGLPLHRLLGGGGAARWAQGAARGAGAAGATDAAGAPRGAGAGARARARPAAGMTDAAGAPREAEAGAEAGPRARAGAWPGVGPGAGAGATVPVYASGLDPEGAEAMAARQLALGVTAFKLKVGFGAEADQRAARALREVVGGAARIMVDANQAWTPRQAVAAIAGLAGAGLHWVEEPVRCDDLRGLAEVRRAAGVPTAAGENLYGLAAAQAAVALDAVDVLQPDVSKTGGITESLAVARLADAHGRRCALHFLGGAVGLMASAHVAAAAAGGPLWLELDANPNPLREGLLLDPPAVRDGALLLPAGPGLGIALDPAALRRYGVDLP